MQRHENLFNFYGNKIDVYRKFQDEYVRDQTLVGLYLGLVFY